MAFDGTIPQLNNLISSDIPQIQENFSLLGAERIVEHNLDVASPTNGYYVRWENGLQICFYISETLTSINNSSGSIFVDSPNTYSYPANFISEPKAAPFLNWSGAGSAGWAAIRDITNSSIELLSYSQANSGEGYKGYIAIGRWK